MLRMAVCSFIFVILAKHIDNIQAGDQCKYLTIPICDEEQSLNEIVAGQRQQTTSHPRYGSASPGKRGPLGPRGEKGEKGNHGPPGNNGRNISIQDVKDIIELKVQEKLLETVQMTGGDFCKSASAGVHSVMGEEYACDGHGWTVFQNRVDSSVDFQRSWMEYRMGFGDLNGNFWLGLDKIRKLVRGKTCQLRMHVETFAGEHGYANYSTFSISDEGNNFQLLVGGYSGNTGNGFETTHNGMKFSTKDRDNDLAGDACTTRHGKTGGWWYNGCFDVTLNAEWGRSTGRWRNIVWYSYKGHSEAMKTSYMMLKCD